MKKILAIFDGTKYSDATSKYAIEMARATGSMLVGVFIRDMRLNNFSGAYGFDEPFMDFQVIEDWQKEELAKVDLNIKLFQYACDEKGVHHKVHLDKGVPIQEIIKESIFADIAVIDSHTGFFSFDSNTPGYFLKEILADSHCPVLVVPQDYHPVNRAIICYDGQPSSVYALKMFAYLFTGMKPMKTIVASVNKAGENHLKEGSNLKELVKQHFLNVDFMVLKGNPEDELVQMLKQDVTNSIVVMGAYGQNAFSRLFHQSLSNRIIKDINMPVFITHQ